MRRLMSAFVPVLALAAPLALAMPTAAQTPPGPEAVIEVLADVCPIYVKGGDQAGALKAAEGLGFIDFYGTYAKRAGGVHVFIVLGLSAEGKAVCTVSLDAPTATSQPLPGQVGSWAGSKGFRAKGKPAAKADERGKAYIDSRWTGAAGALAMSEFPPNETGRVNVVVRWTAG
jgi:hypothetical protein